MSPHAPDLTALLADGSRHDLGRVRDGWTATVRVVPGTDLLLPTGRLVACEPSAYATDDVAFCVRVEPGTYRVELVVADIVDADGAAVDTVNAAARVVVRDEPVATWTVALPEGEDAAGLADDEIWAYPVDGGTGSFASPEALAALAAAGDAPPARGPKLPPQALAALAGVEAELRDDDGTMDPGRARGLRMLLAASREMARLDLPGGAGEVGVHTDPASGANVVSFRSGDGDGAYGTWVGYTAGGAVACFLTDFTIVTELGDDPVPAT